MSDDWQDEAICKGKSDLFYPPPGVTGRQVDKYEEAAKALCAACPVRSDCYQTAVDNNETWGIWGGVKFGPKNKCGTFAGFTAHRRRGEPPCEACRAARNAYYRASRASQTPRCGTSTGRRYHQRRGELVCEKCAAAYNAERRERRRNSQLRVVA